MEGWIKLHRAILDNDLWKSEPFSRGQAWVDLLLLANHKESFFYKRGHKVVVKRGQIGRSSVEFSARWKWSRTKVNKFLKDLEKEQQIELHKSNVTQILTLVNYDLFQEKEQQTGQQKSSRKAAEKQQKDTYKNEKNEKNEKKKEKAIADFLEVCEFFQSETGKRLDIPETDSGILNYSHYQKISSRLREGATVEDCKRVIALKNQEWKNDPRWKKYIRIQTLFGREKFTSYKEEVLNSNPVRSKSSIHDQHDFKSPKQREAYFFARLATYQKHLDTRLYNTEYRKRAFEKRDVEGLIHELEAEKPELLKIEFKADEWQHIR